MGFVRARSPDLRRSRTLKFLHTHTHTKACKQKKSEDPVQEFQSLPAATCALVFLTAHGLVRLSRWLHEAWAGMASVSAPTCQPSACLLPGVARRLITTAALGHVR